MSVVEDVTNEALALTNIFVADIKRMMGTNGAALKALNMQEKQIISGLLAKLMRAATGMVKEARSLAKDARDAAQQMTYEDKRKLIVDFIGMMPPEHRAELRAELGWGGKKAA